MLDFLPENLKNIICGQFHTLYEVRIRVDKPIEIVGKKGNGIEKIQINYQVSKNDLCNIILKLSNFSIFSIEESLKNGYVTSSNGERVGVCGDVVIKNGEVITIKNFTSVCIRFPNDIKGCSNEYYNNLNRAKNCLVVSPPFHGKTTFIRDLARAYSDKFNLNVLYLDERDELSAGGKFYLGKHVDVLRYTNKDFGFKNGVRAYNPDVIVCDEIMSLSDCKGVRFALNSGVKVIASAHADTLKNLLKKQEIYEILKDNLFEDIIILENFKIKEIRGDNIC